MKPKLQLILWDLDGTLIDSEATHEEAALDALQEIGFSSELAIPAGLEGSAVFELLTNLDTKTNPVLFKQWQQRSIELALAKINNQHAIKQSIQLVKHFANLGITQSIVSNSPMNMIKHSLQQLELSEFFPQVFSRDSVEFGKPHPQLYNNAVLHHQQQPENCLCFEDSKTGIKATQAAQLKCIGIGINSQQYQPHLVCDLDKQSWLDEVLQFINSNYSELKA